MFPGPGAEIIRNEAGEPIGWDYPPQPGAGTYWCDWCGFEHVGECPVDREE